MGKAFPRDRFRVRRKIWLRITSGFLIDSKSLKDGKKFATIFTSAKTKNRVIGCGSVGKAVASDTRGQQF